MPCNEPIRITYRTRLACGVFHDVYIESISFVNGVAAAQACGTTMNVKDMVKGATALLLVNNPMNFPPADSLEGACNSNWRVMTGACWKASFQVTASGMASDGKDKGDIVLQALPNLWPCSYSYCCLQMIRVCIINGKRVVTEIPGGTNGECEPNPLPGCVPVCD